MYDPNTAVEICAAMGWELATIGRSTRNLPTGKIAETEKSRIIVP